MQFIFVICSMTDKCYIKPRLPWLRYTALQWILEGFLPCSKHHKGRFLNGEISVLIQCEAKKMFNGTSPPMVTAQLPQMLSQPASPSIDRCHCPTEKVQSIPSNKSLELRNCSGYCK